MMNYRPEYVKGILVPKETRNNGMTLPNCQWWCSRLNKKRYVWVVCETKSGYKPKLTFNTDLPRGTYDQVKEVCDNANVEQVWAPLYNGDKYVPPHFG